MRVPESGELYSYHCDCGTILEIAQHGHATNPKCPHCTLSMWRHSVSSVLVPIGHRLRTGDCRGCGGRIKLVPAWLWRDYCPACLTSMDVHAAQLRAPLLEWLPADPDRRAIADRLLTQALS